LWPPQTRMECGLREPRAACRVASCAAARASTRARQRATNGDSGRSYRLNRYRICAQSRLSPPGRPTSGTRWRTSRRGWVSPLAAARANLERAAAQVYADPRRAVEHLTVDPRAHERLHAGDAAVYGQVHGQVRRFRGPDATRQAAERAVPALRGALSSHRHALHGVATTSPAADRLGGAARLPALRAELQQVAGTLQRVQRALQGSREGTGGGGARGGRPDSAAGARRPAGRRSGCRWKSRSAPSRGRSTWRWTWAWGARSCRPLVDAAALE
jgi:hypothetical protein